MAARVIWAAGWTLLLAVVLAMAAVITLGFATITQETGTGTGTGTGTRTGTGAGVATGAECRPVDVMLGRDTDCEGWPTGSTMPMLLGLAAVAAWGVPERRRGNAAARIFGCLATVVAAIVMLAVVGDLTFTPRGPTMLLLWGVLLCGLLPLLGLVYAGLATRRRVVDGTEPSVHTARDGQPGLARPEDDDFAGDDRDVLG